MSRTPPTVIRGGGEEEPITIVIYADVETREGIQALARLSDAVKDTGISAKTSAEGWKEVGLQIREQTYGVSMAISPVRSLSWDMMLMGRGLSVLNTSLLGSNQQMKEFIGYVYAVGAILRIATTAVDLYKFAVSASAVVNYIFASSEERAAKAIALSTTAKVAATVVGIATAPFTGGVSLLPMVVSYGFQHGGVVPETGPYILHAGETVIPRGGDNFSAVTINMQVGSLASSMDVDRMLDAMALRMAQESRRRLGV